ncbi:MAG: hypothetical protein EPN70_10005 [Paraburkholderia sp.]|uniref:hypothetical protein n=1 Tax=Paraburkholderia sp. TaxID=1926495 RepID=UPI0012253BF9|nr:hypothetical protein [Paraburkholderia sp.]TAM04889.1 MAG: hypothetical protein EPN70_10005 [Paraburkholderia sp.]TAM29607.1 MAG: hypothetical protein EPN59_11710 [Paraburkholderia sp.]
MTSSIPDDTVRANLSKLDADICLPAAQVARLLGTSEADLKKDRDADIGMPYVQQTHRGAVVYRVQDVRAHLENETKLTGSALDQYLAPLTRATDR